MQHNIFDPRELLKYPLIMNVKDVSDFLGCCDTTARRLLNKNNCKTLDIGVDRNLIYRDDLAVYLDIEFDGLNYLEQYNSLISEVI